MLCLTLGQRAALVDLAIQAEVDPRVWVAAQHRARQAAWASENTLAHAAAVRWLRALEDCA
jgi:hypothetical protein